jgi:hypothetical protein
MEKKKQKQKARKYNTPLRDRTIRSTDRNK